MEGPPRSPNALLAALPADEFEALRPHLQKVPLVQGTVIVGAGERLSNVFFPHDGAISLVVSLAGGGMVEIAMIGRDSIFGAAAALGDTISLNHAIVQLPGLATILDVRVFRAIASRSISFCNTLFRHEQAIFAQAQQSVACNAIHSVEGRLARCLLRMVDLAGRKKFELTQESLAQMIGVQRNSISTAAHALQEAGIVRYSRGNIEIIRHDALRSASCECYEAVKTQSRRLSCQA